MIADFVDARQSRWERLEQLVRRRDSLVATDIDELGRLYRQATSDLAIARRDFPLDRVTLYLEHLVGRAHPAVYRRRAGQWRDIARFFALHFPAAYRAAAPYTLVAFALFAGPFIAAFVATQLDPLAGRILLSSPSFVTQVESGENWLEFDDAGHPLVASMVMTNNIRVAVLAFAGGILAGVGTVVVMVLNGLSIGALVGLAMSHGLGDEIGEFVAAHGGVELSVVFMVGGAGLRLGHALLAPGLLPRRAALGRAAGQGRTIILGSIPLLVIAGLLEGLVSPSALPVAVKVAVGVGSTVALYGYVLLAGRSPGQRRVRAFTSR